MNTVSIDSDPLPPLYYYKTLDGSREVEFVIEKDGGVIPIEVKATNGATVSLNEPRNRLTPLHSFETLMVRLCEIMV